MRDTLIEVAIRLFGEQGFEGTSTRQLATEASTTMSNITYHFGGKEGLYLAAGQTILSRLTQAFAARPIAPLGENATPQQALATIRSLVRSMGEFMLDQATQPMARFVARLHEDPGSELGAELREKVLMIGDLLADAIAKLRPELSPDECKTNAFFIYAMTTCLRSARAPLCAMIDVPSIAEPHREQILDRLELFVEQALTA